MISTDHSTVKGREEMSRCRRQREKKTEGSETVGWEEGEITAVTLKKGGKKSYINVQMAVKKLRHREGAE